MSETGKTGRFELQINAQGKADIIDWVESKEKNAICIYNDLGVLPFSSAKAVCDKLNEQEERIKKLQQTIDTIAKDYEESHGMDIRNAEWFTAW